MNRSRNSITWAVLLVVLAVAVLLVYYLIKKDIPKISGMSPHRGPIGTEIHIIGRSFKPTGNVIVFNGKWSSVELPSENGTDITYTLPPKLYIECTSLSCPDTSVDIKPILYDISVRNISGESNKVQFTVTSN